MDSTIHQAELSALLHALREARNGDLTVRLPLDSSSPLMAEIAAAFNALAERADGTLHTVVRVLDATERGALGTRAELPEAAGAWQELVAHANRLSDGITQELRNLIEVTYSVARGDLSLEMTAAAGGELRELNDTINAMVRRLRALAAEVARVSREVAGERGRAPAPDAQDVAGVWKELTENLTLAEQLALVSRYKSEFLANMSHDLRTPLNSVLILAKLLFDNKEANLTARQREYAQAIHSSGGELLSLINDILDLSKVEAGKIRVNPSDVAIADVMKSLERMFRPVAEQKGLELALQVAAGVPEYIHTDALRLHQVLQNLLANALKFTERGSVSLCVTRAEPGAEHEGVSFAVRDTGIGIARDKQGVIFEAFQQADGTTFERYGGTGLGLSISRQLATLLGGGIRLESTPGHGSTFTLSLSERFSPGEAPQRPGEVPRRGVAATPAIPRAPLTRTGHPALHPARIDLPADPALAGTRALVVGDVRDIFAITSVLESQRLIVRFAETGAQALELIEQDLGIEVVLMDVSMPGVDGLETLRALRRSPSHAALPIIALTDPGRARDEENCRAAGATDALTKPVDTERLLQAIRESLVD